MSNSMYVIMAVVIISGVIGLGIVTRNYELNEKPAAMRDGRCEFFAEGSADRLECLIRHDRLMGGKLKEGR